MQSVQFEIALDGLTMADIKSIATQLDPADTTAADEIAATGATLASEHALRRTRRQVEAALAARTVGAAVQDVARRERVRLPDDAVTKVARAAGQYARALVAGDEVTDEAAAMGSRWQHMLRVDRVTIAS